MRLRNVVLSKVKLLINRTCQTRSYAEPGGARFIDREQAGVGLRGKHCFMGMDGVAQFLLCALTLGARPERLDGGDVYSPM